VTEEIELGAPAAPTTETSHRKRRRRHGVIGCLLGLGFALLGLATGRLGQLWIAFDVFSQFTLQFVFAAVSFSIGLLMPRGKILIGVALLIGMIVGLSIWPYHASQHVRVLGTPSSNERALHVASFNTWYGNQNVEEVSAEIARINADVVTLIEFGPNKQKIYDELVGQYPFQVKCPDNSDCQLGILSKFPLENPDVEISWTGPDYISASLGADFGGLTIFGIHTTRFPHPRAQFTQIKAMAGKLETVVGPHIVMGDMNATPFSRVTQTLAAAADMTRLTNLPTWPAQFGLPQVAIDHIFASPGIRALASESIGNNAGSDHFPVFMTLAIPVK
jgi:endonuclease/exonuclease/phosphatase (EEP) superfamily protein YafD